MDYNSYIKRFALRWLRYCRDNGINISDAVKRAQIEYKIKLSHHQLYNWSYGNIRSVSFYTLVSLSNIVGKDVVYFLSDSD